MHAAMTKSAIVFAFSAALGAGGGYLLDRTLDTRPWLVFLGFCLGAAAGLIAAYMAGPRRTRQPIYTRSASRRTPD